MQQVITIQPDGTMSGLQVKPGKGIDLTKLGKAHVVRASEILWHEEKQLWYVSLLNEERQMDGLFGTLTWDMWTDAGLDHEQLPAATTFSVVRDNLAMFFPDYDRAVIAEIAYLDAMRLKGIF
ncbi:hypothetical protein CC53_gp054 [Rhizobium phage vB_RleS_L338C]|uniref:hypothetical protein n=1 Tax=Rhizobium phage vB_RleS_L338C TaxID=1414737 RepID=UPI0003D8AA1F|nr:hypothetical protein CC53_gp054 [Rhizobium phage vB_RleS_L338C]AHC30471.1 hypothetical protein L338C_054 [Rhizobium phage vB_RleS_L338C]QNH72129.1 hypothetical protein P11VFA_090 [Rhizobium phage P11VFA]